MRKLPTAGLFLAVSATIAVGFFVSFATPRVEARPQYKVAFSKKYGDTIKKVDCKICHPKESKKVRNDYGDALGKALGKPNTKDADKIDKALDTVAKKDSKVEGKTYGDLIADGKNPGSDE